jgi:hypothetical protein
MASRAKSIYARRSSKNPYVVDAVPVPLRPGESVRRLYEIIAAWQDPLLDDRWRRGQGRRRRFIGVAVSFVARFVSGSTPTPAAFVVRV